MSRGHAAGAATAEPTRASQEEAWAIEPHACRHCGGRILRRGNLFRCAGCGIEARDRVSAICGCGLYPAARRGRASSGPFRCGPNPSRGPQSPAEIVILCGGDPAAPGGAKP